MNEDGGWEKITKKRLKNKPILKGRFEGRAGSTSLRSLL